MSEPYVVQLPGPASTPTVVSSTEANPLTGAQVVEVGSGTVTGETLNQLSDVDTSGASAGQVLVRGDDGVWRSQKPPPAPGDWGDRVMFSTSQPDPSTTPDNAVWVHLGADMRLYRKAP